MRIVTVSEIRRSISKVLDMLTDGEEIIITRYGKPIARMMSVSENQNEGNLLHENVGDKQ